ncbi:mitochondrial carrier domain-containing protein [Globomyces pollinis-pini]|nr:mitochondrial carrier domain-containing protein [Globomyces pollinis-pini]
MVKGDRQVDSLKSGLAGAAAGVFTVLAGQPFDTLKVRLQTSNQYKGLADCFRQTIAKDGLFSLYRGMSAPLLGVTPMFALSFWSYDMGCKLVTYGKPKDYKLSMTDYFLAGGFSAIPTTAITTPMERIKVVLQTQDQVVGGKKYNGMFDAGAGLYREGGVSGLYRGTIATLARDAPGSAVYFLTYEYVRTLLTPKDATISYGAVVFAGGMAGVSMWCIAIPPDVIKSRIQASPAGTYKGFFDCGAKIITSEGPSALFKGLGPALLRAFPANAAGFLGRALSMEVMHQLW